MIIADWYVWEWRSTDLYHLPVWPGVLKVAPGMNVPVPDRCIDPKSVILRFPLPIDYKLSCEAGITEGRFPLIKSSTCLPLFI